MGWLLEGKYLNDCVSELANTWFLIVFIQEINPNTITPNIDAVTSNIQSILTKPF
jgi:hypothetical protein